MRIPDEYLAHAHALIARAPRSILGLVGAPGAGKSTVAETLCAALGNQAVVVPMDGFHLANAQLARLQRQHRKGAPDTFDAAGFAALLARLRHPVTDETVYAPEFRREIEEPIANAIAVASDVPLVITEGNYLLLDDPAWRAVHDQLDETWYVDVPDELRIERLVARHRHFGRDEAAARAWVDTVDEPNARRIVASRERADRLFRW